MATETNYNIIKVQELREITEASGNDEIIINDVDGNPLETKKIKAEQFAYSIKDYILPIASAEILGGIKVGQGLSINPVTGVLTNDIYQLNDLADVQVVNPQPNQVLSYDGVKWANREFQGITGIIAGDGLSGGGFDGDVIINVNPGDGISIENDRINVNTGLGLRTDADVVLTDNGDGLTYQGNKNVVNPGDAIKVDHEGVHVNYGRGLTLFGPLLEPNLGAGLMFYNDKVQADIGLGLHFNANTIELHAYIDDLLDVEINQPQNEGEILIWEGGVWTNGTPIKYATREYHGTTEIATRDEIRLAWNYVTVYADSPVTDGVPCTLVIDVNDLGLIRKLILDDFNMLLDGEAIVYVHREVQREWGDTSTNKWEDATNIPQRVQELYDENKNIHMRGNVPVERVAFQSVAQAVTFFNGRSPLTLTQLTVYVIGYSERDPGRWTYHKSKTRLVIAGDLEVPTQSRQNNVIYTGGGWWTCAKDSGELTVQNLTVNINGTPSDPYKYGPRFHWCQHANGLVIRNFTLMLHTTYACVVGYWYQYEYIDHRRAYVRLVFDQDFPGTIHLETICSGNWSLIPHGNFADFIGGDTTIKGFRGNNYARNRLYFKQAHTGWPAHPHHSFWTNGHFNWDFRGYTSTSFPNYGNWAVDAFWDFGGTNSYYAFAFDQIRDGMQLINYMNTNIHRSSVYFYCVNRGNISIMYTTHNRQGENLQSLFDIDQTWYPTTLSVTARMAAAFRAAGMTTVYATYFGGLNEWNGAWLGGPRATRGSFEINPDPKLNFANNPEDDQSRANYLNDWGLYQLNGRADGDGAIDEETQENDITEVMSLMTLEDEEEIMKQFN